MVNLAKRLGKGLWNDRQKDLAKNAVICSQVFGEAHLATHRRVIGDPVIPARLSSSNLLEDIPISWRRIAKIVRT